MDAREKYFELSEKLYQRIIETDDDELMLLLKRADKLFNEGKVEEAIRMIEEVIENEGETICC